MRNLGSAQSRWRFQEGGLLIVVLVLGVLLTLFGGSVERPRFTIAADGSRERVFAVDADGNKALVKERVNLFLNAENLTQLAKDTSFIAIMAVGMTAVIIAGQIDLSIGSIYALAGVIAGLVLQAQGPNATGASVALAAFLCPLAGLLCGFLNGAMVVALRVHPFIITLGSMAIFRGIAFVRTSGLSIGGYPEVFRNAVKWQTAGGLTLVPLLVMVIVLVLGGLWLSRTTSGRRIYAVGGNEMASRYSGLRVGWVKMGVFTISGLSAGIASLLALGYYGSATSADGQGYELNVIAAAVVGGASLSGGRGTALGAVLGALIIQIISSGIVILHIDQNYSQLIIGSVVILAVVLDQFNQWLSRRRLADSGRKT
ncbi:MAG TPA: ABC transporter permease [Candidatus Limnocylindria bacterium]|jgi:ribose transport system permease protein|nr:ABC transporter permease [Candidatus Limnocylindria bacterium]